MVSSATKKIKKIPSKSKKKPNIENKKTVSINIGNFLRRSAVNKNTHTIDIKVAKWNEKLKRIRYKLKKKFFNNN